MHKKIFLTFVGTLCCAFLYGKQDWKMVWNDEFDYQGTPDNSKWSFDTEGNNWDWGNDEAQNYTPADKKNAWVADGNLIIEARKENYTWPGDGQTKQYTSARLRTLGKGDWTYGKVEVRALLPTGRGMWPAIWLLPSEEKYGGWPSSGELDIMENVGFDPNKIHCNIHTEAYNHKLGTNKGNTVTTSNPNANWHVYSMEWDADKVIFFLDGDQVFRFDNEHKSYKEWPYDQKFHLLLNIAVGGGWGGEQGIDDGIFPQRMLVDYVRVYEYGEVEDVPAFGPLAGNFTINEDGASSSTEPVKDNMTFYTCGHDLELDASNIDATDEDFVWTSNGETVGVGRTLKVNGFEGEKTFHVEFTNKAKTGFDVKVIGVPLSASFDTDNIAVCEFEPFELKANVKCPEDTYQSFFYKDGKPIMSKPYYDMPSPDVSGLYSVEVKNRNCVARAEVVVTVKPNIQFSLKDQYVACRDSLLEIPVNITVPASGKVQNVVWSHNHEVIGEENPLHLNVTSNYKLMVQLSDPDYCPQSFEVDVIMDGRLKLETSLPDSMGLGEKGVYLMVDTTGTGFLYYPSFNLEVIENFGGGPHELTNPIIIDGKLMYEISPVQDAYYKVIASYCQNNDDGNKQEVVSERYIQVINITADALVDNTSVMVYPTKVNNELYVAGVDADVVFRIATANGTSVAAGKLSADGVINVSALASGIYYLQLNGKAYAFVKK